ncbi:MAG: phosphodiester glycosidase family protein [Pseudomonadota bacterium]
MRYAAILICACITLTACEPQPAGEPVVRAELGEPIASDGPLDIVPLPEESANASSACQDIVFEGIALTHCIADPAQHRISASLAPSSGENFGTIDGWAAGRNESAIAFVMNAGMYDDTLRPLGYFVQGADRLKELDRGDGDGNFYLKPNGVFFGSGSDWRILDTDTFLRTIGTRPEFGTQSGPMLVVDGDLHPEFQENGPSRAIRNGVGIDAEGRAHFVISNDPISFGQFGRFFRDELQTPNALFLDGNVSSLWDPATGRMDNARVGPLILVETINE